jgi:hypothetical protein
MTDETPKAETVLDLYEPLVLGCERLGPLVREMRVSGMRDREMCDALIGALGLLYLENNDQDDIVQRVGVQLQTTLDSPELLGSPLFLALRDRVR